MENQEKNGLEELKEAVLRLEKKIKRKTIFNRIFLALYLFFACANVLIEDYHDTKLFDIQEQVTQVMDLFDKFNIADSGRADLYFD